MNEDERRSYYQVQSVFVIIPYLLFIPLIAAGTYLLPLKTLFLITAAVLVVIVMPIYFLLVVKSDEHAT
jgi:hypothetical protein